jgi:diguanylate cyclase (GGDEF)-like protein
MRRRFDEVLPILQASADSLPSLPAVAVEILRLSRNEDAGLDEYARVIASDPALAAKLLKLSNSSAFGIGQPVTTLERATLTLGLRTVQLMALSFSLAGSLPRASGASSCPYREFWRRSLCTAVAGRELGALVGGSVADEAFLCGLLAYLGHLVLAQCLPEDYEQVLQRCKGWPSTEAEREVLGFDHAQAASALLQSWGMPAAIHRTVAHREDPAKLPADTERPIRQLADVVHMAGLATQIICDQWKGEALKALHDAATRQGLTRGQVDIHLLTIESSIRETASMLEIELPPGRSHYEILEEARHQMARISLGTAFDFEQVERRAHQLESENRKLAVKANTDELTSLGNRAYFDEILEREVRARKRDTVPDSLGLLMLDIDHFKRVNDTYGHPTGDAVLRMVGHALRVLTRDTDAPARFGGEEFAVIVPSATAENLALFAERLRKAIAEVRVPIRGRTLQLTVSVGGALLARAQVPDAGEKLVAVADDSLYRAKRGGRDRVVVCPEDALQAARKL